MQRLFYLFIILLFAACTNSAKQKPDEVAADTAAKASADTLPNTHIPTEKEAAARRKEMEALEQLDSARLAKVFRAALAYAEKNKHLTSFTYTFEMTPDDSSFTVKTELVYGHLLSTDKKHLLVRRELPSGTICSFLLAGKKLFSVVCESEQYGASFISDTLQDINGDSYKDFVVHWYPLSGCCRRDAYNVYLYKPASGGFTDAYFFINPTFSPKEKIIRGVEYGHPGEAGLYKYKWNKFRVDTLEYIYRLPGKEDAFIKTKKASYKPQLKDGKVLKSLPAEYKHIVSIEWFLL